MDMIDLTMEKIFDAIGSKRYINIIFFTLWVLRRTVNGSLKNLSVKNIIIITRIFCALTEKVP